MGIVDPGYWHNYVKKSEALRPLDHTTSSDCFTVRACKLAGVTIGENVNNQLLQDSGWPNQIVHLWLKD